MTLSRGIIARHPGMRKRRQSRTRVVTALSYKPAQRPNAAAPDAFQGSWEERAQYFSKDNKRNQMSRLTVTNGYDYGEIRGAGTRVRYSLPAGAYRTPEPAQIR